MVAKQIDCIFFDKVVGFCFLSNFYFDYILLKQLESGLFEGYVCSLTTSTFFLKDGTSIPAGLNPSDQQLTFLGRSCVKYHTGDDCSVGSDERNGNNLLVCRYHCSMDGCNRGNGQERMASLFCYALLTIMSQMH